MDEALQGRVHVASVSDVGQANVTLIPLLRAGVLDQVLDVAPVVHQMPFHTIFATTNLPAIADLDGAQVVFEHFVPALIAYLALTGMGFPRLFVAILAAKDILAVTNEVGVWREFLLTSETAGDFLAGKLLMSCLKFLKLEQELLSQTFEVKHQNSVVHEIQRGDVTRSEDSDLCLSHDDFGEVGLSDFLVDGNQDLLAIDVHEVSLELGADHFPE